MSSKTKITFLVVVLLVSMLAALTCVFCMQDTKYSVIMGCCWVCIFLSITMLVALYYRLRGLYEGLSHRHDTQVVQLSDNLIMIETSMADRIKELDEARAEIQRLMRQNSSYRHMISGLRQAIRSDHDSLEECCQLLEEMRKRAEQGDRLKSAFLANISHELRTPMNAILGFSSYLGMSGISDERRQQYIEILNSQCRRFLDAVNDISYYSKLQVGEIDICNTAFDINAMLDNVVNQGRMWIRDSAKDIDISIDAQMEGKVYVNGFENGYLKILNNLINNAVKYTHSGSITIGYTISDGQVTFQVKDTGIGFDMSKKDLIFGSFNQSEAKLSRNFEGTGLGLSICRSLVRLMNGEIHAESRPGVGSRFWFRVPVLSGADTGDIDLLARVDKMLDAKGNSYKVLVVTPFAEDCDFIRNFFKTYGVEVVRANGREELSAMLDDCKDISVAFIDWYSLELHGIELASMIFDRNPRTRIVFMSDTDLTDDQMSDIRIYSGKILEKPLTTFALSKILQ